MGTTEMVELAATLIMETAGPSKCRNIFQKTEISAAVAEHWDLPPPSYNWRDKRVLVDLHTSCLIHTVSNFLLHRR
jgi:hypothetical protein